MSNTLNDYLKSSGFRIETGSGWRENTEDVNGASNYPPSTGELGEGGLSISIN